MLLTRKELHSVALLARLQLNPDEEGRLAEQLTKVIQYIEKLAELDTTQVEPFTHVPHVTAVFREDIVTNSPNPDAILANAPDTDDTFFRVPKIIE
jgi:aspartyl-tRNA(Asn)/glutamyl-tRNA(Gln) amidotransferase subunit C